MIDHGVHCTIFVFSSLPFSLSAFSSLFWFGEFWYILANEPFTWDGVSGSAYHWCIMSSFERC